jgi:PRC-barrel domain
MLRSMRHLDGFTIGATDGDIGTVKECYFDDVSYTVRYVVVDTGGWLGERKVLLTPIAFRTMDWKHERITTGLTKSQVEKSPNIDTQKPVSRQHEIAYYGYYGYTPYWAGSYLWGAFPYPYPAAGPVLSPAELERAPHWDWETGDRQDSHLRSSREVTGYHIQATDGDIGHVEDFLVDDRSWAIRYVVVDTTNLWPGKKVLVAPAWIERVDWGDAKVHVDLGREQIKASPEYDPARPIERGYETRLHGHYGRPHYWGK